MRRLYMGIGIIVIVAIALAVVLLAFGTGAVGVSGPTTLSITSTPAVIKIGGTQYVLSLHSSSPASGAAYLYIGRSPVFINPTLGVMLVLGNYTRISGNGSTYANMEIKLNSVTNSIASITITPLQAYLAEPPDYSRISVIGHVAGSNQSASTTAVTVASTTTVATTTINQTATTYQRVLGYLKINEWYGLMANETTQFANSRNCTPTLYNSSYRKANNAAPVVPLDYWNVSVITPYAVTLNITNIGKGNYAATYSTKSATPYTTGPVLILVINASNGDVLNVNQTGAFKGLTYSQIQGISLQAASIGNACGTDVAV